MTDLLTTIFSSREKFKRDIALLERQYADWDIKLKAQKIHEGIRKIYPELEFEGEGIEKFNEIFEKVKHSETGKKLTDIGSAFIFPVLKSNIKKPLQSEGENYELAIVSPFPNNYCYNTVKINSGIKVKAGDYVFIKKGFAKINNISKEGYISKILYIDEVEYIDKVKAYKISQNLLSDFRDKIQAMLPEETEKEEGEKIEASVLSAEQGIGLLSIVYDNNARAGILKIYEALRNSLPDVFKKEEISLNFNSPFIKRNSIKITIKTIPLFETRDFEEHPQQSLWFENAYSNQTISSPLTFENISKISKSLKNSKGAALFLYRNANIIHNFKGFFEQAKYRTSKIKEEPIYDEEIQFWLISQRNLYTYSFDNIYVSQIFKNIFANVVQENLNLFLPENLLNLVVENTSIKESLHRGFESFCRKGVPDSTENAENFIKKSLKEMSNISMNLGEGLRLDLEKKEKKPKKPREEIYNKITLALEVAGRLPYNDLIEAVKNDLRCDEQAIKDTIDFINKTHPSIKTRFADGVKFVEFK